MTPKPIQKLSGLPPCLQQARQASSKAMVAGPPGRTLGAGPLPSRAAGAGLQPS